MHVRQKGQLKSAEQCNHVAWWGGWVSHQAARRVKVAPIHVTLWLGHARDLVCIRAGVGFFLNLIPECHFSCEWDDVQWLIVAGKRPQASIRIRVEDNYVFTNRHEHERAHIHMTRARVSCWNRVGSFVATNSFNFKELKFLLFELRLQNWLKKYGNPNPATDDAKCHFSAYRTQWACGSTLVTHKDDRTMQVEVSFDTREYIWPGSSPNQPHPAVSGELCQPRAIMSQVWSPWGRCMFNKVTGVRYDL